MRNNSLLSLAALFVMPIANAATIVDNHSAAVNDRFANDGAFIGNGFDWSGVGRIIDQNGTRKWGTLLNRSIFVSASHFNPIANNPTISFYPDNDPNSTPIVRTITSQQVISGSDVVLGVLNIPVPANYKTYSYTTENIVETFPGSGSYTGSLFGQTAFISGNTPTADGATGYTATATSLTNQVVGENVLDTFAEDVSINGFVTDVIASRYNSSGDANYRNNESLLQGGDSGAPVFVNNGGDLQVVGINSGVSTLRADPNDPNSAIIAQFGLYGYIGNYSDEVDLFIANNTLPTPEPSTAILTALGSIALLRRQR